MTEKQKETFEKFKDCQSELSCIDYICVDPLGELLRPNRVTQRFSDLIERYDLSTTANIYAHLEKDLILCGFGAVFSNPKRVL